MDDIIEVLISPGQWRQISGAKCSHVTANRYRVELTVLTVLIARSYDQKSLRINGTVAQQVVYAGSKGISPNVVAQLDVLL